MEGLIFDLDGTLLNSMPSWEHQLNDFLIKKGIVPPDDLLDRTKTLGLETATGIVLKEFGLSDDPTTVYQQFQSNMSTLYRSEIPLKPGVREFLDEMRKRKFPMAIATATSRILVEQVLRYHNLNAHFQSITTVAEVGIGKQDPKIFLVAADKLGLLPQNCTVFEDSLKAVLSAKQAGFRTIAIQEVTNPTEQDKLLQEANLYIKDFFELFPFI